RLRSSAGVAGPARSSEGTAIPRRACPNVPGAVPAGGSIGRAAPPHQPRARVRRRRAWQPALLCHAVYSRTWLGRRLARAAPASAIDGRGTCGYTFFCRRWAIERPLGFGAKRRERFAQWAAYGSAPLTCCDPPFTCGALPTLHSPLPTR